MLLNVGEGCELVGMLVHKVLIGGAEVTAIVNNMLGREADVDFVTEHYDELNHFSDLAVSHWGYYHIVEATNDHDYTKPSSGENWTELN